MTIFTIKKNSNPILRKKAKKISKITSEIEKLALGMADTIENYASSYEAGTAIAAPQVGKSIRLVVIKDDKDFLVFINPEIIKSSKTKIEDLEGCMSIPKTYGLVKRYKKIKIKALNLKKRKIEFETEGLLSRILQHEIDHLDGILFTDRIKDKNKIFKLDKKGRLTKDGKVVYEEKNNEKL